jgi:hypothetical protein
MDKQVCAAGSSFHDIKRSSLELPPGEEPHSGSLVQPAAGSRSFTVGKMDLVGHFHPDKGWIIL